MDALAFGELKLCLTLLQQNQSSEALPHLTQAHRMFTRLSMAVPHEQRYADALKKLHEVESVMPSDKLA